MIKTRNHMVSSWNNIAISPSYFRIFIIVLSLVRYFDFSPPYSWLFTSVFSCFHPNSSFAFHDCGFAFLLLARNQIKRTCTFVFLLTLYFLCLKFLISNLNDEEIMCYLKLCYVLKPYKFLMLIMSRLRFEHRSEEVLDLNRNFFLYCVVSYRNTSEL